MDLIRTVMLNVIVIVFLTTILDILFKNNQPTAAVPGGSVFNGLVSLGRAGVNVTFISEVGGDHVGDIILNFMEEYVVKNMFGHLYI